MTAHLLDVNVLIALLWPAHESHETALNWFQRNARHGWATCPFTQAGFVRVVSNPSFSQEAVTPQEAISLLEANLRHPEHRFWSDDLGLMEATQPFVGKRMGHRQVTDAYLLGLALKRKGKLVSLDQSIAELLTGKSVERDWLVVL